MKVASAVLLLTCVGLCLLVYSQATTLRAQRQQIQQLDSKLVAASTTTTIDLQEKCARQSREEYRSDGWEKRSMAGFTNHFNTRMNKCFMEIQDTDTTSSPGTVITSKTLSDAFEGKVYGTYIWSTDKKKKYWEVPPLECDVILPSGEKKSANQMTNSMKW
jgi:hypothetical protein